MGLLSGGALTRHRPHRTPAPGTLLLDSCRRRRRRRSKRISLLWLDTQKGTSRSHTFACCIRSMCFLTPQFLRHYHLSIYTNHNKYNFSHCNLQTVLNPVFLQCESKKFTPLPWGFLNFSQTAENFYRASATQYADARYWYNKSVRLFVSPSVRPSVTFRYQMKTA